MRFNDDRLDELLTCDEDAYILDVKKVEKVEALIESAKFLLEQYSRKNEPIDLDKFNKKISAPLKKALDTLDLNWKLFNQELYKTASSSLKLLISQIDKQRLDQKTLDEKRGLSRISRNNILYLFAEELLIYLLSLNENATAETETEYKKIVNDLIYCEFGDKRDNFRFNSKYKVFELTYQSPNSLCPPSIHRLDPINSLRKK